jgi:hypothetical protein
MPAVIGAAVIEAFGVSAATATAAGIAVAGVTITYASILGSAILIGGGIAYSSIQSARAQNQNSGATADPGRSVMQRDALAYQRAIYGEILVTGPITFMATTGAKNEFLHLCVIMAGHECDTLGTIYFDAMVEVDLDSDGNAVLTSDAAGNQISNFSGNFHIDKHTGWSGQAVDANLLGAFPAMVDANFVGKRIAYLHALLTYNTTLYPNGIPTIKCMVKGKKVYDPRDDSQDMDDPTTWKYSSNWSLCVADYLNDKKWGKGIPWSRINVASVIEAANISDETITLALVDATTIQIGGQYTIGVAGTTDFTTCGATDSSVGTSFIATSVPTGTGQVAVGPGLTEPRYSINGTVTCDQDPDTVLADMISAGAGCVIDTGGIWFVHAGAWRTPSDVVLTDDDLRGTFTVQPRISRQSGYNGVKGTYISAVNDWAAADFPPIVGTLPVTDVVAGNLVTVLTPGDTDFTAIGSPDNQPGTTFIATGPGTGTGTVDPFMGQDGGTRLFKDVTYGFVVSASAAQRVSKIDLDRARQQIVFSALYSLKAMQFMPGDVVPVTRAALGWTEKLFEVTNWSFQVVKGTGDNAYSIGVLLTMRETASGCYDWDDGEEISADIAPNSDLPDPSIVPTPTGLTLLADSTTAFQQPDGTFVPRLKVTWNLPNNIYIEQGGRVRVEYKKHADATWLIWAEESGDQTTDYITDVLSGVAYDVRINFESPLGAQGAYEEQDNYVVSVKTTAPSLPTGLTATGLPEAIRLDWVEPNDPTIATVDIYELGATTPAPVLATTPTVSISRATSFTRTGLVAGSTLVYWIRNKDSTGNPTAWVGPVSATVAVGVAGVLTALNGKNHTYYLSYATLIAGGTRAGTHRGRP